MDTVNVHEAKTRLSQLLERVEQGETITIARAGTPVAVLSPLTPPAPRRRRYGVLAAETTVPADPRWGDEEVAALFQPHARQ